MTLLLIDLSSLAYPIWHQNQTNPDPTATVTQTLARIRAIASGQPHVAICCDSKRSLRREADPTYKANRPERDANLLHQIAVICDALRADGFPVWACDGFEADDVIASAVAWARAVDLEHAQTSPDAPPTRITIVSADKDLLQLVSDTVHVSRNGALYDLAKVHTDYGVTPNQFVDYLSLVGDASDNIKGADGIGPKRASAMLTKYGTLEGLYDALTHHTTEFTPSTASALRAFESRVDDVRNLVRLRTDADCPFSEVAAERSPVAPAASTAPPMAEIAEDVEDVMTEDSPQPQTAAEFMKMASEIADAHAALHAAPEPLMRTAGVGASHITSAAGAGASHTSTASTVPSAQVASAPRVVTGQLVPFERQLEPNNFLQARALATDLFESRLFGAYGSPQAVLSTVLAGRELGMQSMASLRAFHIIDNKPTLAADAMRALVIKSGKARMFKCVERTPERCTFKGQRSDDPDADPLVMTYTIAEARAAWSKGDDAWSKSNWGRSPADMLVARCSSKMARLLWPDVVFGLYDPAEIADGALETVGV